MESNEFVDKFMQSKANVNPMVITYLFLDVNYTFHIIFFSSLKLKMLVMKKNSFSISL